LDACSGVQITIGREQDAAAAYVDASARAFFLTTFVYKFVAQLSFYRESGRYPTIDVI
jgi:hypothetical protein